MTDICIFPIPGCVTFPGTLFPLHVFEPRYREMIHHCLDTDTLVAICHPRKTLSVGKRVNSIEQALTSNQATYQPYDVFSAGRCELMETLDDGRMLLNVHVEQRYQREHEIQLLPYQIHSCKPLPDRPATALEAAATELLRDKILHRLLALAHPDPDARKAIERVANSDEWQAKDDTEFSFALFGVIRFDPEILQSLLEMESSHARLAHTLELLNEVG